MDGKFLTSILIFLFFIINCSCHRALWSSAYADRRASEARESVLVLKKDGYDKEIIVDGGFEVDGRLGRVIFSVEPLGDGTGHPGRLLSRTKRAPKIGPKSSFMIWSRRSGRKGALEVRRKSMQDNRFKHSHSIGVKNVFVGKDPPPRSPSDINTFRSKRSTENDYEDVNVSQTDVPLPRNIPRRNSSLNDDSVESTSMSVLNSTSAPPSPEITSNDEPTKANSTSEESTRTIDELSVTESSKNLGQLPKYQQNETKVDSNSLQENEGNVEGHVHDLESLKDERVTFNATSGLQDLMENIGTLETVIPLSGSVSNSTTTELTHSNAITPTPILSGGEFSSNQTTFFGQNGKDAQNISSLQPDQTSHTTVQNVGQLEPPKRLETEQAGSHNGTVDSLSDPYEADPLVASNETTTTQKAELSVLRARKVKLKQVKPNPDLAKWIKGATLQLPVLTVPLRKCPQGRRIRQGKCVQVY